MWSEVCAMYLCSKAQGTQSFAQVRLERRECKQHEPVVGCK